MRRAVLVGILATICAACKGSPAAPTSPLTSVTIAQENQGQTIFIGQAVQFRATATSSGQTQSAAGTWGSDAPGVATVSQNGLVTAVAAGEATIFVDANPRGTLRIRVLPNFEGTWTGIERVTRCQESGALAGLCGDPDFFSVGDEFRHDSRFTQTAAAVDAVIDEGEGFAAAVTGTITVGGELQLPSATFLPGDPDIIVAAQNWRSRADVPTRMTGDFDLVFSVLGVLGSATVSLSLQDVVKTSSTALPLSHSGGRERILDRIKNHRLWRP